LLAYPSKVESFKPTAFTDALSRLGLDRLAPMLDHVRQWERSLGADEQQALVFARIILHAPPWVIFDDVLASLDAYTLERALDVLAHELKHSGVIHIGTARADDSFFSRVLHLTRDPAARRLSRARSAALQPAWEPG
jgi:vitamin B12/bleomycin/antimicrobial peptide transport system ATP-binding/permease protein